MKLRYRKALPPFSAVEKKSGNKTIIVPARRNNHATNPHPPSRRIRGMVRSREFVRLSMVSVRAQKLTGKYEKTIRECQVDSCPITCIPSFFFYICRLFASACMSDEAISFSNVQYYSNFSPANRNNSADEKRFISWVVFIRWKIFLQPEGPSYQLV